ncbi:hypothetical protein QBC37DRAFT_88116 [Rhypophila decipiens]|uniref:Extracellular serine-rich protein n=1 Tax=Rhypophila decipiens TaxID=261697 RepID=A0AAN6YI74_9PEZI|nr:hypothetical protein QBC37DRAFT_88116 [Rhypophila decipiens]
MAMAQRRNWWLLALLASSPLTMAQMDHSMPADHSLLMASHSMDHSGMSGWETMTAFPSIPTHAIRVGDKGRSFQPNITKAKVGDTIEFQFYPSNHSVVRADYMFPCFPTEKNGNGKEGFFSGFYIIQETDGVPKWRWTLNTENPVFFYSSGNDDCNRYGMVGAINAKPFDLQHQYEMALDSPFVMQPDAASEQLNPPTTTTSSTSTTETKPTPSNTAAAAATEPSGNNGLGAGGIAGVVVGAVAGIAMIAGIFYWYGVMRARQKPPTQPDVSPMTKSSYLSPGAPSFDTSSGMFTGTTVPSPPPQSAAFVDGDTIYVPVKRSTIASGDVTRLPSELYNPAELYHPGMQGQNSDRASWMRPFDQQTTDNNSVHQQTTPTAASAANNKPSELSG